VVLVQEVGRALGRRDVEVALGAPVVAEVPVEAGIARVVDGGGLGRRPPRALERALRGIVAASVPGVRAA
jgi:ribosomal protein S12 methylthiotransferase accessory factor YcaO